MRCIAVCLLAGSLVLAEDRKPKFVLNSNEFGFTVGLPGKPRTNTQQLSTLAGTLNVTTFRYDGERDPILSVTVTDFPGDFGKIRPEKIFEGMIAEMKGADGRVSEEKEITLGAEKHVGRYWRIEAGKVVVRVRVYLVGTRLYQVMANGSRDGVKSTSAEDLFNTFEVVK